MSCPDSLIAGDSWSFSIADSDRLPSAGWSLAFRLSGATNFALTVATNVIGDGWDVSYTAVASAVVAPGRYEAFATCTKGAITQTITQVALTVGPNPATAIGIDSRSWAAKTLEVIEAALGNRMTSAMQEYEIAGRKARFYSMTDLIEMRSKLQYEIGRETAAERACAGLPDKRRIMVRFGP